MLKPIAEERIEKARTMQERMVEAQRLLGLLAESSYGHMETVAEVLAVSGRLIDEAWVVSDELFPDELFPSEEQVSANVEEGNQQ
jgi:hypothetical protein